MPNVTKKPWTRQYWGYVPLLILCLFGLLLSAGAIRALIVNAPSDTTPPVRQSLAERLLPLWVILPTFGLLLACIMGLRTHRKVRALPFIGVLSAIVLALFLALIVGFIIWPPLG